MKQTVRLKDLPKGTVVRYCRNLYVKTKGADGDTMTNVNTGHWQFIEGGGYPNEGDRSRGISGGWGTIDWKSFTILFQPKN